VVRRLRKATREREGGLRGGGEMWGREERRKRREIGGRRKGWGMGEGQREENGGKKCGICSLEEEHGRVGRKTYKG